MISRVSLQSRWSLLRFTTLKSELGSELRKLMIFSAYDLDWFWKVLSSGIEALIIFCGLSDQVFSLGSFCLFFFGLLLVEQTVSVTVYPTRGLVIKCCSNWVVWSICHFISSGIICRVSTELSWKVIPWTVSDFIILLTFMHLKSTSFAELRY